MYVVSTRMPDRAGSQVWGLWPLPGLYTLSFPAAAFQKTPLLWVVSFRTTLYRDSFKTPAPDFRGYHTMAFM